MKRWISLGVAIVALTVNGVAGGAVLRVVTNGVGDGSSWAQAASLTNALTIAQSGDNLWIAKGTYTNNWDGTTSFKVTNNLTLYGGFTNGMAALGERDWTNYPAILSGANARRVVTVTATNVVLDGLTIRDGYLDGGTAAAGLYKDTGGSLVLANCNVINNRVKYGSGAAGCGGYFASCSVTITNCTFLNNGQNSSELRMVCGLGFYATSANIVIQNSRFHTNTADSAGAQRGNKGGGFYCNAGTLRVTDTDFIGNKGGALEQSYQSGGGAAYLGGACTAEFRNCRFKENETWYRSASENGHGGALWVDVAGASTVTVANCLFVANKATIDGGALYLTAGILNVLNCTIVTNSGTTAGGAIYVAGGSLAAKNSILWDNVSGGGGSHVLYYLAGSASLSYCDVNGVASPYFGGGPATLSKLMTNNPQFATNFADVHLKSTAGRWDPAAGSWTNDLADSPCVDVGDPSSEYAGEPANNGVRINLGMYGNTAQASKSPTAASPTVINQGADAYYTTATLKGKLTNGTLSEITIYYGTNALNLNSQSSAAVYPPQQTGSVFSVKVVGLLPATTYYYACYATNAAGEDWADTDSFASGPLPLSGGPEIIHVDKNATGQENGLNWLDAFKTVGAGVAAAKGTTNTVWVAQGTYQDAATIAIATNLAVYGGFTNGMTTFGERNWNSYPAIFSGSDVRRVVSVTGTNVVLDGLTIRDGYLDGGTAAAGLYKNTGGSLVLANCSIINNRVKYDSGAAGCGGYFASCSVTITNCTFLNNGRNSSEMRLIRGLGFYATGANIVIQNSRFLTNTADNASAQRGNKGGAFYCDAGTLRVTDSDFIGNKGGALEQSYQSGGGVGYLTGACTAEFRNCRFRENETWYRSASENGHGGALWVDVAGASTVTVANCLFVANKATIDGGAFYLTAGNLNVMSCTFATNSGTTAGGVIYMSGGTLAMKNSILWDNASGGGASHILYNLGTASLNYCDVNGVASPYFAGIAATQANLMTNNPLFAANFTDLHLKSMSGRWNATLGIWTNDLVDSPCIDAGDPAGDYSLEPSDNGGRINMGAYGNTVQASKSLPAVAPAVENRGAAVTYNSAVLSGELTVGTPSDVKIYYGTNDVNLQDQSFVSMGIAQTGSVFTAARVVGLIPSQVYYYACFATNRAGTDWADTGSFTTGTEGPGGGGLIIHVDKNAVGAQNGKNWFDAFKTVVAGTAAANGATNTLWVAQGTYQDGSTALISTNVTVYGGFTNGMTLVSQRNPTNYPVILDGENIRRVLDVTASATTLDGLTIQRGYLAANSGGAAIRAVLAGGTLSLRDCRIVNNGVEIVTDGTVGAGLYAQNAKVSIDACLFTNNVVYGNKGWGGALYIDGGMLVVSNSTFIGNKAGYSNSTVVGGGAGWLMNVLAVFRNCLFRSNTAVALADVPPLLRAGALYFDVGASRTATVENCVFTENRSGRGGAIGLNSGTLNIRNCTLATNDALVGGAQGGAIYVDGGMLDVKNSILWDNANSGGGSHILCNLGNASLNYVCVNGTNSSYLSGSGTAVVSNVTMDNPLFAVPFTDLHLKSPGGRWNPATGLWTNDPRNVASPCVDAGDPADDFSGEPAPNGHRVNLGAYGNTWQASKTLMLTGTLIWIW